MKQLIFAALSLTFVAFLFNKDLPGETAAFVVDVTRCNDTILDNRAVKVCLDSVVTDSRCPSDAQCISKGAATARFTFTVGGQSTTQTLSLKDFEYPGYANQFTYNGFQFEFISLEPYPLASVPQPYSAYKAELRLTRL